MRRKKWAFTLAEVLITMSIVGVVAAMTIPNLQYSRLKKEYSAKMKNFYSKMNNAILDMEIDKGSFRDMILPNSLDNGFTWYIQNIDPYMGHELVKNKKIYFKDGSSFWVSFIGVCMDVLYDLNGDKAPNSSGKDIHRFLFCFNDNQRKSYFGNKDVFFGAYGGNLQTVGTTRTQMVNLCKTNPAYCTKLLQNDQWEFKLDYPYKF